MEKKTFLITGASRGLGSAMARIAAQHGIRLALMARSQEALEKVADGIVKAGGEALVLVGDVTKEADCQRVVEMSLAHFGQLDALINNSGTIAPIMPVAQANLAEWERNWNVNVRGPVALAALALPALRQSRGRIINVSSGAAERVIAGWGAYSISKAAINHFTRVLALEEPEVVSVAVRPGVVDTAMQAEIRETGEEGMPPAAHQRFVQYYEKGQLLPPEQPGLAMVALALYAPAAWSGEFISWDDPRISELLSQMTAA